MNAKEFFLTALKLFGVYLIVDAGVAVITLVPTIVMTVTLESFYRTQSIVTLIPTLISLVSKVALGFYLLVSGMFFIKLGCKD